MRFLQWVTALIFLVVGQFPYSDVGELPTYQVVVGELPGESSEDGAADEEVDVDDDDDDARLEWDGRTDIGGFGDTSAHGFVRVADLFTLGPRPPPPRA